MDSLCITEPGCYTVTVASGYWNWEVSWALGSANGGAVARGSSPAQCDFSVGGYFCPSTCGDDEPPEIVVDDGVQEEACTTLALEMYDANGDGWSGVEYVVTSYDGTFLSDAEAARGTLGWGFQGEDALCLADGCYAFFVGSGQENEAGWALGAPDVGLLLSGASSSDCVFGVNEAAAVCAERSGKAACGFYGAVTQPPTAGPACAADQAQTVVRMVDSFGDGWDGVFFTIASVGSKGGADAAPEKEEHIVGTLETGAYGEFPYCLDPGCYRITLGSGEWHEEVSWQLVDEQGAPIAAGNAPESCGFALGGAQSCALDCNSEHAMADDWFGSGDDDYWGDEIDDDDFQYAYYYEGEDDDDTTGHCDTGNTCTYVDQYFPLKYSGVFFKIKSLEAPRL